MGIWISRTIDLLMKGEEAKLIMLGLDAAGKTTILYQLRLGENIHTLPTIGFNVEVVKCGKVEMTMWDIGGQDKIRPLWRYYFQNTNGIIFVIDSVDKARLSIARTELNNILESEELHSIPLLILANKQDVNGALKPGEIELELQLRRLCTGVKQRDYSVHGCCGLTGEGVEDGLLWLGDKIRQNKRRIRSQNSSFPLLF
mmetsp:Transcript_17857/g.18620  ORF Transcript_17857/g.18620 Transcript_17857/m.18620 type:complete len:200 (-) Transcript_17857:88-687(-)